MSYGDETYNTGRIIYNIFVGLFVIIMTAVILGAVIGFPVYHAHQNQQKVERMTELCQSKGYDGWTDDDGSVETPKRSYCYNTSDK